MTGRTSEGKGGERKKGWAWGRGAGGHRGRMRGGWALTSDHLDIEAQPPQRFLSIEAALDQLVQRLLAGTVTVLPGTPRARPVGAGARTPHTGHAGRVSPAPPGVAHLLAVLHRFALRDLNPC